MPDDNKTATTSPLIQSTGSQYGGKVVLQHDQVMDSLDELSWVAEAFRKRREGKLSVNALRAALIMCAEDVMMRVQLENVTAITSVNDDSESEKAETVSSNKQLPNSSRRAAPLTLDLAMIRYAVAQEKRPDFPIHLTAYLAGWSMRAIGARLPERGTVGQYSMSFSIGWNESDEQCGIWHNSQNQAMTTTE